MLRRHYARGGDEGFRKRRHCTIRCERDDYRDEHSRTPKTCPECGTRFVRKEGEAWASWIMRQYCSSTCSLAVNRRENNSRKNRHRKPKLTGVAYRRALHKRITAQVAWVFEIANGVYVNSSLIRALRGAEDEYEAELILGAAIPRRKGKLLEGTRRRVMERIKKIRVAP